MAQKYYAMPHKQRNYGSSATSYRLNKDNFFIDLS